MRTKAKLTILFIILSAILMSGSVLALTTTTPSTITEIHNSQTVNKNEIKIKNGEVVYLRNNYSSAVEHYQSANGSYIVIKTKLKINGSDELKEELVITGQEALIYSNQAMINYLDALKNKIVSSQALDGGRLINTSQEFEYYTSDLLNGDAELRNISSPDGLKTSAASLRQKWAEIEMVSRLSRAEVLSAKLRELIEKFNAYQSEINAKINNLDQQGQKTDDLKEKFIKFNEDLLQVKVFFNNAQGSFAQMQEDDDLELYKTGTTYLKQSRAMMKAVQKDLGEILKMM